MKSVGKGKSLQQMRLSARLSDLRALISIRREKLRYAIGLTWTPTTLIGKKCALKKKRFKGLGGGFTMKVTSLAGLALNPDTTGAAANAPPSIFAANADGGSVAAGLSGCGS